MLQIWQHQPDAFSELSSVTMWVVHINSDWLLQKYKIVVSRYIKPLKLRIAIDFIKTGQTG